MATIGISQARRTLSTQLDRVEAGEEVAITRQGRVVAVLVRPDVLAARRPPTATAGVGLVGQMLSRAREEPVKATSISPERVEELVADVRASRSGR